MKKNIKNFDNVVLNKLVKNETKFIKLKVKTNEFIQEYEATHDDISSLKTIINDILIYQLFCRLLVEQSIVPMKIDLYLLVTINFCYLINIQIYVCLIKNLLF